MEFIVCYPFLTSNATVVLHDVGMNLISNNTTEHATKVLFDVVSETLERELKILLK